MKKYVAPVANKIEFQYNQQVVASSSNNCYWKNDSYWSYSTQTCTDKYNEGTATQVPA